VEGAPELLDIIFEGQREDPTYQLFRRLIQQYVQIIKTQRPAHTFTPEMCDVAADEMTEFGDTWILLFGVGDIPNYVHTIICGHVTYFLRAMGSVSRYCNQAWEAMNGRVKRFIYNRTQRGGHGGAAGEVQSTAKALMNYIGRLWLYELDGGDGSDDNGSLANLVKRYSFRYWTQEDEAEVEFETAVVEAEA